MDENNCGEDLSQLYSIGNIDRIIADIYLQGIDFYPSGFGNYYYNDHKMDILLNIQDSLILYKVTNLLLEEKNGDGLMVIWDNANLHQLSHFNQYFNYVLKSGNFYRC